MRRSSWAGKLWRGLTGIALIGCLTLPLTLRAAEPSRPIKMASAARFDLRASAEADKLDAGSIIQGEGQVARMNWLPAAEQPRGYTVTFAINDFLDTPVEFRFEPAKTGVVHLTLLGPWQEASPGVLVKQVVLWKEIRAEAAELTTSPFRWQPDRGWTTSGDAAEQARLTPLNGQTLLGTWHDESVTMALRVTGGQSVTLRLVARAIADPGLPAMARILASDTPAHRALEKFRRGVNVSNYLEAPPGQDWGIRYSDVDFKRIKAQGFDHVRIPVGWQFHAGPEPEFRIDSEFFPKVDTLVDSALQHRLAVILNVHGFEDFDRDPPGQTPRMLAIWRQVGQHYAGRPAELAFEFENEPHAQATTRVMNRIYPQLIGAVRPTNPRRTLLVGTGNWNDIDELAQLRLPDDDQNLIVTLHCYDPFLFTHQGANWAMPRVATMGIIFPGPPQTPLHPAPAVAGDPSVSNWLADYSRLATDENPSSRRAFANKLERARQWSDYYGRPVHIGEFGCYERADHDSRMHFYREFREALAAQHLAWAMWDWKAGFKYWDDAQGRPVPGMHQALFGQ